MSAGALKESCGLDLRLLLTMDFSEKNADPVLSSNLRVNFTRLACASTCFNLPSIEL